MSLEQVTIAITSFLRPGYLKVCLEGISKNLPDAAVLVADDSDNNLCSSMVSGCLVLPFDSGLTRKRNAIVRACQTPFLYMGSDDFDFSTKGFRLGLEQAVALLSTNPEIDLVGGRVDNNPYESHLEYDAAENVMRERRLVPDGYHYQKCDLVVNAFLARTSTLREVPWDENIFPIGGEHGDWFLDMKAAGKTTVILRGLNINTLSLGASAQDPRYNGFRRRCFSMGHTKMLKKRGLKDWIGA